MRLIGNTLRHDVVNMTSSAGSLIFLLVGSQIRNPMVLIGMLGFSVAASFISWFVNLARFKVVSGVATSRVASASQGYTELYGRASVFPNEKPLGKRSGFPCVWFRCITERENDGQWQRVADEVSETTFLLADGSGECVINPDGAEVITTHKRVWKENGYRQTEWALRPGEPLYVIGEFRTEGGASAALDEKADVGAMLNEWKRDRAGLLSRFDTNRDGEIDLQEWEAARKEAHRVVRANHNELRLQDGVHIVRRPGDGRLFLLSNLSPTQLARRYERWAWAHIGIFFVAILSLVYLMTHHG